MLLARHLATLLARYFLNEQKSYQALQEIKIFGLKILKFTNDLPGAFSSFTELLEARVKPEKIDARPCETHTTTRGPSQVHHSHLSVTKAILNAAWLSQLSEFATGQRYPLNSRKKALMLGLINPK